MCVSPRGGFCCCLLLPRPDLVSGARGERREAGEAGAHRGSRRLASSISSLEGLQASRSEIDSLKAEMQAERCLQRGLSWPGKRHQAPVAPRMRPLCLQLTRMALQGRAAGALGQIVGLAGPPALASRCAGWIPPGLSTVR